MSKIILALGLILSLQVSAAPTPKEAKEMFNRRGEDYKNAEAAAKMYGEIAKEAGARSKLLEARFLTLQLEAYYYYAQKHPDNKYRVKLHEWGNDQGDAIIKMVGDNPRGARIVGEALYWKAAHLGKWGQERGPLSSLRKWPELKKTCQEIISMGQGAVVGYGADRILGRAYHVLPSTFGGKNKALSHLENAYKKTYSEEKKTSTFSITTFYLAETYIALNRKNEARNLLQALINADPTTLDPNRIPETKEDQADAKKLLSTL